MKLLCLSRWLPYPASNGSKLRVYNLLKRLARRGHELHLLTFYEQGEDFLLAQQHLNQFCTSVGGVLYKPFQPHSWQSRAAFLTLRPRSVRATYRPEMTERVEVQLASGQVEAVIAFELDMAGYGTLAHRYDRPALLEELEVSRLYNQFKQARRRRERLRYGLTWFKVARYVRYLARHYRAITVVSAQEQAVIQPLVGSTPVQVLPNGADLTAYRFQPYHWQARQPHLVFNGALTFNLNYDAMSYFLREVFPTLRQSEPELKLVITGRNDGVDRLALAEGRAERLEGVIFTGYLDDLNPTVAGGRACVAPLLNGGGTRLKILEAFALGTPVISTTKGAEGLNAQHEKHFLCADTPQEFVQALARLKHEPDLATNLTRKARRLVEENFDWDSIAATLDNLIGSIQK